MNERPGGLLVLWWAVSTMLLVWSVPPLCVLVILVMLYYIVFNTVTGAAWGSNR